MNEKLINVYFGVDNLPYKDTERQVHFPIVGGAFLGASNTTKIRFYFDYIGDSNTTWVSVAKLPNGKQGSRVLPVASDENGNYAELELSNWYTQAKGDVYIALQGYQGGVEYEYDSETELYEVHGTPTIQTTGSIKLAINYAPIGDSPDYNDEFSTYQEILAALGDKINEINGIIVVDDIIEEDASNYENGQLLWDKAGQIIYSVNDGEFVVSFEPAPTEYVETQLELKADKSTTYTKTETDSLLNTKQNILINQFNIKSINNQSLLGSGNIDIQSGGGAWGEITGNIQDQTDLQNEFQDIRAEIAGRAQNISISYSQTAPATDANARLFKKFDNTAFTDLAEFNSYVSGLTLANSSFYSTSSYVSIDQSKYIIDLGKRVIKATDIRDYYNVGNSNLFIVEQTYSNGDPLPDRWYAELAVIDSSNFLIIFNALESKVDVSGLATTGDLSIARYEIEREIAPEYSPLTIYAVGDKVIYNHKLYTRLVNTGVAETTWDATHWSQISVASGFVDLDKAQVISGVKTFTEIDLNGTNFTIVKDGNNKCELGQPNNAIKFYDNNIRVATPLLRPQTDNATDLGNQSNKFANVWSYNIKGITTISQADYDALVSAGTVDADTLYFITEN